MKKKSKVEIKSDVAVNLFGKRLPGVGIPCKRKSWFDHNVIIRSYVYASSVVHATEIHLRSHIGARTYMRVYTNSAELDAQSERGIQIVCGKNRYANSLIEVIDMRRSSA